MWHVNIRQMPAWEWWMRYKDEIIIWQKVLCIHLGPALETLKRFLRAAQSNSVYLLLALLSSGAGVLVIVSSTAFRRWEFCRNGPRKLLLFLFDFILPSEFLYFLRWKLFVSVDAVSLPCNVLFFLVRYGKELYVHLGSSRGAVSTPVRLFHFCFQYFCLHGTFCRRKVFSNTLERNSRDSVTSNDLRLFVSMRRRFYYPSWCWRWVRRISFCSRILCLCF